MTAQITVSVASDVARFYRSVSARGRRKLDLLVTMLCSHLSFLRKQESRLPAAAARWRPDHIRHDRSPRDNQGQRWHLPPPPEKIH